MTPIKSSRNVGSQVRLKSKKWVEDLRFVFAMWLLSRLVIVIAIQLIAPLLPFPPVNHNFLVRGYTPNFVPSLGWHLFSHWDGAWYRQIATLGYDYAKDGQEHSVAFFPLFPLISRGVMALGLPFDVAGTLVNNLAFLGALLMLYRWTQERYGIRKARWATAVLAWCPFSLFGTVIYTEGLFLFLTTAALRAFDNHQHGRAALWGAMATATRPTGAAIIPAFLFAAWKEQRSAVAYATGIAAGGGLFLYSVYCLFHFGEPLAFFHANRAWKQPNWLTIFAEALTLQRGSLTKVVMFFGGGYLLWYLRNKLPPVAVSFGFCSLVLILASGALSSVHRYTYGIVSLSLALGLLIESHPRWGYALMGFFLIGLISFAIKFAWWGWVA
jgi:Gpi18-like mannosyltransferase